MGVGQDAKAVEERADCRGHTKGAQAILVFTEISLGSEMNCTRGGPIFRSNIEDLVDHTKHRQVTSKSFHGK